MQKKRQNKSEPLKNADQKPLQTLTGSTDYITGLESFPLVLVRWLDAAHGTGNGWVTLDEFTPQMLACESVGFLVFDGKNNRDEDLIVLSSSVAYQPEGKPSFVESFTIPKSMVVEVRTLR
jgi:hypothetical protein